MAIYKALVSFSGAVSMTAGNIKELTDKEVIKDLLNAKYIEEVKPQSDPKAEPKPKTAKAKK